MSEPLDPDTALDVRLSAIIARHQYATDPAPVIDELWEIPGADASVEVGRRRRAVRQIPNI